eukprot:COSAG05_NODE_192_length_14608_cov_6.266386_5_plen_148_part_00
MLEHCGQCNPACTTADDFTNWEAPWYLGDRCNHGNGATLSLGHEHLLALHAPRAFLLIAGEADRDETSRPYLEAAQGAWAVYGGAANAPPMMGDLWSPLSIYDHGTGHRPTQGANDVVYRWVAAQFHGGQIGVAAAHSAAWQWPSRL